MDAMLIITLTAWLAMCGQSPAARSTASQPTDASKALGATYVDGHEGFSIRPPAGWQLDRRRAPDSRGVTVLKMIGPTAGEQEEDITIRQVGATRRQSVEEMLKSLADGMGLEFNIVKTGTQQVQEIAGKPGGFLSATYAFGGKAWQRYQAFVEYPARSYFMLTYKGPIEPGGANETIFQLVAASLKFLPRNLSESELADALKRGRAMFADISGEQLKKAVSAEQFLKLEGEGRTTGFVVFEAAEYELDHSKGVRVTERGWTFESDDAASSFEHIMYVSSDLQKERWKSTVTRLAAGGGGRGPSLDRSEEQGARTGDTLASSQSYGYGAGATQNAALRLPETYLSRALVSLLPRLLGDLTTPRKLAFTTFDHPRADIVVQVFDVRGPSDAIPGRKAFLIDQYVGLSGVPTHLYVDETGTPLRVEFGGGVLTSASRSEMERALGGRVSDADQRIREIENGAKLDRQRFAREKAGP